MTVTTHRLRPLVGVQHTDFASLSISDASATYDALTLMMDVANGVMCQPRMSRTGVCFSPAGEYLEEITIWLAVERDGVIDGLRNRRFKDRWAEQERIVRLLGHEAACGPDLGDWLATAATLIAKLPQH